MEYFPIEKVLKRNNHPLVEYIKTNVLGTIEILVDTDDYAVSYNGKFYIRTGSTTQELVDRVLQRFILKKPRETW